jgi:hypothetical protein
MYCTPQMIVRHFRWDRDSSENDTKIFVVTETMKVRKRTTRHPTNETTLTLTTVLSVSLFHFDCD